MVPRKRVTFTDEKTLKLRRENKELKYLFDIQYKRMQKATKIWQQATGKCDVWPDLGELLDWFLERYFELERIYEK